VLIVQNGSWRTEAVGQSQPSDTPRRGGALRRSARHFNCGSDRTDTRAGRLDGADFDFDLGRPQQLAERGGQLSCEGRGTVQGDVRQLALRIKPKQTGDLKQIADHA